jgi:4-amino-4-deoxy-L-arabinose transferase-like glycosyltransferase
MNTRLLWRIYPFIPLAVVLLAAFGIRVYHLNYNSPFLDEAQYIVLGRKVLAGHWQEAAPFSWVGGLPLLYPPIAAVFAFFGGVLGARFLNVLLGTLAVYLVYEFARNLKLLDGERNNNTLGLIAAAFLSVLAIPIYVSRLAIYDMLSFTFLLLGFVCLERGLLIRNPALWQRENRFFAAAVAFLLSVLAKYVTLAVVPLIVTAGFIASSRVDKHTTWLYVKYLVTPLAAAVVAYFVWHAEALKHFRLDQIGDTQRNSRLIVMLFAQYTLLPFLLALVGGCFLLKKRFVLTCGLLVLALSVMTIHVLANSSAAVHQHAFISIVFLLPLGAAFLTRVLVAQRLLGSLLIASLLFATATMSYVQVRSLQAAWPNSTEVMQYLRTTTARHEIVLSSEDDVTVLALKNLRAGNLVGPYNFSYKGLTDDAAYRQALQESYFDVVLVNEDDSSVTAQTVRDTLGNRYVATYQRHPFVVYRRVR